MPLCNLATLPLVILMHIPVLLAEVLHYLDPRPGEFMIDGTFGSGGHSAAILEKILPGGKLLGVDWDKENIARSNLDSQKNVLLAWGNYADLPEILKEEKLTKADGLLLDLGFSSEQLESSGRGFSFLKDEPLLMTYDDGRKPVRDILKKISEKELAEIIRNYGGERMAGRIAKAIVTRERQRPIATTGELAETVRAALPKHYERGRIDRATRTFQALRIYANGELESLSDILANIRAIIKPGGRAVIISFHSLEDRIVKQAFRALQADAAAEILTKKPVVASAEEIKINPRSRSAKLRAVKML